ncbi:hypothetical protein QY478_04695, partial (plasmid) [Klebsiella pneumoniae]
MSEPQKSEPQKSEPQNGRGALFAGGLAAILACSGSYGHGACVEQDDKGWDARKRAYCLKIQPATGSFARNLIYSTKPRAPVPCGNPPTLPGAGAVWKSAHLAARRCRVGIRPPCRAPVP